MYLSTKNVKREFWTIVISVIQIFGTVLFVSQEISRNFDDVCGDEADIGGCFAFNLKNIIYFWIFFVIANLVWIVIPI
jgi:hypothetical protein